jgi:hypothetical protein
MSSQLASIVTKIGWTELITCNNVQTNKQNMKKENLKGRNAK